MRSLIPVAATLVAALLAAPAPAQDAGSAIIEEEHAVQLTPVEVSPQPMLYVTARSSMQPAEVAQVMGRAFDTLGRFLAETGVTPLGPPMAIYSNWSEGLMTTDVGFPVAAADTARAAGEVLSGTTPAGHALKAVHHGPYDGLAATYGAIEAQMAAAGAAPSGMSWEVYLNEPGVVPDAELVTEIYMQVSAADAAKFEAK